MANPGSPLLFIVYVLVCVWLVWFRSVRVWAAHNRTAWQPPLSPLGCAPFFCWMFRTDRGLFVFGFVLCLAPHGPPRLGSRWGGNTQGLSGSRLEGRLGPCGLSPEAARRATLVMRLAPVHWESRCVFVVVLACWVGTQLETDMQLGYSGLRVGLVSVFDEGSRPTQEHRTGERLHSGASCSQMCQSRS